MAESMRIPGHCVIVIVLGGLFFLFGAAAQAATPEHLPDPTRPPTSLAAGGAAEQSADGPVLQSVLISPGRKVAIISGETVQTGDRVGEARVIHIAEGQVVLARDGQTQTLKLFPGIEKRRAKGGISARDTSRRQ